MLATAMLVMAMPPAAPTQPQPNIILFVIDGNDWLYLIPQ
jgi:hypothetical protein